MTMREWTFQAGNGTLGHGQVQTVTTGMPLRLILERIVYRVIGFVAHLPLPARTSPENLYLGNPFKAEKLSPCNFTLGFIANELALALYHNGISKARFVMSHLLCLLQYTTYLTVQTTFMFIYQLRPLWLFFIFFLVQPDPVFFSFTKLYFIHAKY